MAAGCDVACRSGLPRLACLFGPDELVVLDPRTISRTTAVWIARSASRWSSTDFSIGLPSSETGTFHSLPTFLRTNGDCFSSR